MATALAEEGEGAWSKDGKPASVETVRQTWKVVSEERERLERHKAAAAPVPPRPLVPVAPTRTMRPDDPEEPQPLQFRLVQPRGATRQA